VNEDIDKRIEEKVQISDFPVNFQPIAKAVGIADALLIVKTSGGINQYVPKYDALISAARDRVILEEFNGYNFKELALRYNLTEVWIRNIVEKDTRVKARQEFLKNQLPLFPDESAV
jgi:Mor family transcriptional regulator